MYVLNYIQDRVLRALFILSVVLVFFGQDDGNKSVPLVSWYITYMSSTNNAARNCIPNDTNESPVKINVEFSAETLSKYYSVHLHRPETADTAPHINLHYYIISDEEKNPLGFLIFELIMYSQQIILQNNKEWGLMNQKQESIRTMLPLENSSKGHLNKHVYVVHLTAKLTSPD